MNKTNWKIWNVILPLLFGIFVLVLLQTQAIHSVFHLKVMQLPLPSDIVEAIVINIDEIVKNAVVTLIPAIGGMLLGAILGYAVAGLATIFPDGGYGILFLITAINSIPIVALATIMNRWFSSAFVSKLVVVTIIAMGAMVINAFRGLNDFPKYSLDLMNTYAASRKDIFLKLRMPNSLPQVFTALKINVSATMIGMIISEFFASETSGLGYMIKYSLKVGNQKAVGWAYIVSSSVLSILIYAVVCMVEHQILKWHIAQRC